MPLRSYAIPFVYIKMPMIALKFILMCIKSFSGIDLLSSYLLIVFPRAIMCMISFINDYSIYRICRIYNLKADIRLLAFASSAVTLTFGIRTFSNTIEMALCSMLLYLVSECMILSNTVIYQKEFLAEKYEAAKNIADRVRLFKMRSSLPQHSYSKCALLSTICVIGIFNRPTFICFGLPLMFFWMLRGLNASSRTVTFTDFNFRMLFFILSGLPAFCAIVVIDSLYYGYLSLAQIYIFDISIYSFLVTPVNFIRYNIIPSNTAEHGEHPRYLHLLVNIPILFNILGIISLISFTNMAYKFCKKEFQDLPQTQSFVFVMTTAIIAPVLMLSFFNHQEPRFIIPILIPIVLLHSPKLITGINVTNYMRDSELSVLRYLSNYVNVSISGKSILKVWYMINIFVTIFFGFIHQGGVVQLAEHMSKYHVQHHSITATSTASPATTTTTQIHLVTSHVYQIPESLLIIPSANILYTNPQTGMKYKHSRRFFVYEYGSMDLEMMFKKMKIILDAAEMKAQMRKINYELFLAIPSSKAFELNQLFYKHQLLITYKEEFTFYPHLSTEAFPFISSTLHPCDINTNVDEHDDTCGTGNDINSAMDEWNLENFLRKLSALAHQFGLVLYRVEIKKRKIKKM